MDKTIVTKPNEELLPEVIALLNEGKTITMHVKGVSMRPFIEHARDRVQLVKMEQPQVGDIALAFIDYGYYVIHRIIAVTPEKVTLMGDGVLLTTETCSPDKVYGKVINIIKPNGKVVYPYTPFLMRFARLWKKLLPTRRYLLWIYRALLKLKLV